MSPTACGVTPMPSAQDILALVGIFLMLGCYIIPVQAGGKRPAGPWANGEWPCERLKAYIESHPNCNIAVRTGSWSDRLVVIDVDAHGVDGRLFMRRFERTHGRLPVTVTILTPSGGIHLWFIWPEGLELPRNSVNAGFGVDIRGEGGYALVPPSQVDGTPYRFADGRGPESVEVATANELVVELVNEIGGGSRRQAAPSDRLPQVVREGGRNDACYRYACHVRSRGGTPEDVTLLTVLFNYVLCKPQLDGAEIGRVIASALKHDAGPDLLAQTAGLPDVGAPRIGGDDR